MNSPTGFGLSNAERMGAHSSSAEDLLGFQSSRGIRVTLDLGQPLRTLAHTQFQASEGLELGRNRSCGPDTFRNVLMTASAADVGRAIAQLQDLPACGSE